MLGTIVNALAIIGGSLLGLLLKRGIPEKYKDIVMSGLCLSVILIGIRSALVSDNIMIVIFSVVTGSLIGEFLKIEMRLEKLGLFLEQKVASKSGQQNSIARGFVTASLLFCVGSMAIIGSLESGLTGNHQTLFAKSVLDGVASIIFASTLGLGVLFSSIAVFIYQGMITIAAGSIKGYLIAETIAQMTSVGGLLIMAIGFNTLKVTSIRVGNLTPGIFLPLVYQIFQQIFL